MTDCIEAGHSRRDSNELSDAKVLSEKARDSFLWLDIPHWSRSPKLFRVRTAGLFFRKEILVEPLEFDPAADAEAHTIFDHQVCQPAPVDQDNPLCEVFEVISRLPAEGGGGDEHVLDGVMANQAANEGLHIRAADCRVSIALGLHIDPVQPQPFLVDAAVDAPVARTAELGGCVLV